MDLLPWEQITGETADQYRAFCHYRELPSTRRSIRNAVASEMGLNVPWAPQTVKASVRREHGVKLRVRERFSGEFGWVTRALAYDEHILRVRVQDRELQVRDMIDRHAQLGQFLQGKALEAVQAIEGVGRTFLLDHVDRGVVHAFELGCRIERAAYGVDSFVADDLPASVDRAAPVRELFLSSPAVAAASAQLLVAQRRAAREAEKAKK